MKQVLGSSTWCYSKIIIPTVESFIALYGQLICLCQVNRSSITRFVVKNVTRVNGGGGGGRAGGGRAHWFVNKMGEYCQSLNCRHVRSWKSYTNDFSDTFKWKTYTSNHAKIRYRIIFYTIEIYNFKHPVYLTIIMDILCTNLSLIESCS